MRVFSSATSLPAEAANPAQVTAHLVQQAQTQIESWRPRDDASLHAYRRQLDIAYRYALNAEFPQKQDVRAESLGLEERKGYHVQQLVLGRAAVREHIPALLFAPREGVVGAVLVVHPEGVEQAVAYGGDQRSGQTSSCVDEPQARSVGRRLAAGTRGAVSASPGLLFQALLRRRLAVLTLDTFGTGTLSYLERDRTVDHFACFNPSDAALRIQDVLTGLAYLCAGGGYAEPGQNRTVHLLGLGQAGLWCLLARGLSGAAVDRTVVDAAQFACDDDAAWLEALDLPLLRRAGDLRTAAALTAPGALYIYRAAPSFPSAWCRQVYRAANAPDALHIQSEQAHLRTIAAWLAGQTG
jgi:hypothetical protein